MTYSGEEDFMAVSLTSYCYLPFSGADNIGCIPLVPDEQKIKQKSL
jgi:hypothetical protein